MTAVDALGYLAASLVLATFCAKSMVTLRLLAIASNAAFITYSLAAGLHPIVVLHSVMLPLNLLRLRQVLQSSPDAGGVHLVAAPVVAVTGSDPAQPPDYRWLGVVPRRRVVGRGVNALRPVALRGVDHNQESENL